MFLYFFFCVAQSSWARPRGSVWVSRHWLLYCFAKITKSPVEFPCKQKLCLHSVSLSFQKALRDSLGSKKSVVIKAVLHCKWNKGLVSVCGRLIDQIK